MGEDGFEPSKALPADLQSVPFGHSGIPPYYSGFQGFHQKNISNHRNMFSHTKALETPRSTAPVNRKSERAVSNTWSWWTDSNPRPADYKRWPSRQCIDFQCFLQLLRRGLGSIQACCVHPVHTVMFPFGSRFGSNAPDLRN